MKHLLTTIFLLIVVVFNTKAQINYSVKIESGFVKFMNNTVQIDPGPGWQGYYLNEGQNGIDINLINGLTIFNERLFLGIGLGYQNFIGIDGISVFSDIEYLPLKSRFTPLLDLKIGYDHIWNQYDGGKGTALTELGIGASFKMTEKLNIYLISGLILTQQSSLIPVRIGIRL